MAETFQKDTKYIAGTLRMHVIVIALVVLVNIIIFREVLISWPDIIRGDASLVRDELVPFFSFQNGYLPADTSALTGNDDYRVTYSFLSSWLRFNPLLPIALVIIASLSTYLVYYSIYRIVRSISSIRASMRVLTSLMIALFILVVLIYSKVAHFYTLILGFGMFALATTLTLEQFCDMRKIRWRKSLAIVALVLLNPAIHYHIIFVLVVILLLMVYILFSIFLNKCDRLIKQAIGYSLFITATTLVPYTLIILALTPSSDDIFRQAPVEYYSIYYSSPTIAHILALDTLGHVDQFRYGNYLAPVSRYFSMILLLFSIIGILVYKKARYYARFTVVALSSLTLISIWMSFGYGTTGVLSFHQLLGFLSGLSGKANGLFYDVFSSIINNFINVLRYPHRFQFITLYSVGVMSALGLTILVDRFNNLQQLKRKALVMCLVIAVVILPIILSADYRTVFTGNMGTFLTPYTIPQDLKNIKAYLAESSENATLFVIPSMESGRYISQDGHNYSFLDKYFIYYIENPTYYYGSGSSPAKKLGAYPVYRSIAYGENWWTQALSQNLGATHILVPHNTEPKDKGPTYFPNIEQQLEVAISNSKELENVYSGTDFSLYKITREFTRSLDVFVSSHWSSTLSYYKDDDFPDGKIIFPIQSDAFFDNENVKVLRTDNIERGFYDLMVAMSKDYYFPDASGLPFSNTLIPGSLYTNNTFSITTLSNDLDKYNYTGERFLSLLNLHSSQFIGLKPYTSETLNIRTHVPESGLYKILVHGATDNDTIQANVDGMDITLHRINNEIIHNDYIEFTYYTTDQYLDKGSHNVTIQSSDKSLIIEFASLIPAHDIPNSFIGPEIRGGGLNLIQTINDGDYAIIHY